MRVSVERGARFVYPDGAVVCDGPQFEARDPNHTTIVNPRLVVEVLSPSTEGYDRGDEFRAYRTVESLREYVLVSQDRPLVETFVRQHDGRWLLSTFAGLESAANLQALNVDLPLAEVYAGVEFPPDGGAAVPHVASA
jgi:Uma2 family endonuclease